jgi:hypothetical protein
MDTSTRSIAFRDRVLHEVSQPFFSLEEPLDHIKVDVFTAFATPWRWTTGCFRLVMLAWSLQVLYFDISHYPPHNLFIYMGYLTHWGFLLTIAYLLCSFLCFLALSSAETQGQTFETLDGSKIGRLVKITWALFSIAAPLQICICFLYWTAVSSGGPVSYVSVMEHGVFAIVVLVDGLLVGHIPVRLPHAVFVWMICLCYLIWTLIDAYCNIGNGEWGPAYSDDALYPVLNWKQQSRLASYVSAFCLIILAPGVFCFVWLLSLLSRSRGRHLLVDATQAPHFENDYKRMDPAVYV